MKSYQPMDCDLHDYLEISCMKGYQLSVELIDGSVFTAKAVNTKTVATKEEFLIMEKDNEHCEIRLDQLRSICPLDNDALFGSIDFTINP